MLVAFLFVISKAVWIQFEHIAVVQRNVDRGEYTHQPLSRQLDSIASRRSTRKIIEETHERLTGAVVGGDL